MAVVRDADHAVDARVLDAVWPDALQRARCLDSLLADGLLVRAETRYALPAR
jgi:A/G-specific adenine glycosylase